MNSFLKDTTLFKTQCLINGEWVSANLHKTIKVNNPFDNTIIAEIPLLEEPQIKEAINSAHHAFKKWKKTTTLEKSSLLKKWYHLIKIHQNDIATLMVLEQGKPFKEAVSEVNYAASYIEFYAEEVKRIYGDLLPSPFPNSRIAIIKQPIGVVGIITPWNFPIAMMVRKLAPALASGCTCVIKPDEKTPLSALTILELAIRAGFPKGTINAVTGIPSVIGKEFTRNKKIKKISFTGSTKVGKKLLKNAAQNVTRVTMELGGNAPFIVFEDANIDAAVEGLITSKFRNAGQTCICPNRIFLHEKISEQFIQKLIPLVKKLKVGNGFNPVDIGPLINTAAVKKITTLIENAQAQGAQLHLGGKLHKLGGTFFEPTIISQVKSSMAIFKKEIFGPIISITTFSTANEVIRLANNTKSGLASYFYAKEMAKVWQVAENLEFGMIGVNESQISSAQIPFGGIKESGMGREGSKYGINDYLNIKYVCLSTN